MTPSESVEVKDGQIHMWRAGKYGPVDRMDAIMDAVWLKDSLFDHSRRKAQNIIQALRETQT